MEQCQHYHLHYALINVRFYIVTQCILTKYRVAANEILLHPIKALLNSKLGLIRFYKFNKTNFIFYTFNLEQLENKFFLFSFNFNLKHVLYGFKTVCIILQ